MLSSAAEGALIGIGGVILGALLAFYFSKQLLKDSDKRESARRLHEAFKDEYLSLEPAESTIEGSVSTYLEKAFEKHRSAVYDYSHYLSKREKKMFMGAWHDYIRHPDHRESGIRLRHYAKYLTAGKSHDEKMRVIAQAKKDIENVLSHAKL